MHKLESLLPLIKINVVIQKWNERGRPPTIIKNIDLDVTFLMKHKLYYIY